jgi:hypothetical protein
MRDDRRAITEYTTNFPVVLALGVHPGRNTTWNNAQGSANGTSRLALAIAEYRIRRADTVGTIANVTITTVKVAGVAGRAARDCLSGILAVAAARSKLGSET